MKKRMILIPLLVLMFVFTGCMDILDPGTNNQDTLYTNLDSIISDPSRLDRSDLDGITITFSAMVLTEPETIEFDEGSGEFVYASLSRNMDGIFLLNISDIEYNMEPYSIVSVTGATDGLIYYIQDNETINTLDIAVKSIEAKEVVEEAEYTDKIIESDAYYGSKRKGTTIYDKAALFEGQNSENVAVVYYNFINEGEEDWGGNGITDTRLVYYQGDNRLEPGGWIKDESNIDSSATDSLVYAGKTQLGYSILECVDKDVVLNTEEPIIAYYYDDDFNLISEVEIPVSNGGES